jgi:hypothetical protein
MKKFSLIPYSTKRKAGWLCAMLRDGEKTGPAELR